MMSTLYCYGERGNDVECHALTSFVTTLNFFLYILEIICIQFVWEKQLQRVIYKNRQVDYENEHVL